MARSENSLVKIGAVGTEIDITFKFECAVGVNIALEEVAEERQGEEATADNQAEDVGCEHTATLRFRGPYFPTRGLCIIFTR